MTITELKKKIIEDGRISAEEVHLLSEYLAADGGMTQQKANFLFDLKEYAMQGKVDPSFKKLFVDSITSFMLEDDGSPGEIDESEAKWLRAKIQYNGRFDNFDHALISNLKHKSINFPKVLQYKSKRARYFENALYSSRYLSLLAVIGSIISAIALFIRGGMVVYESIAEFITSFATEGEKPGYEVMFEQLVSSVDIFLFALVLIIFGVGVYELFINKIDPIERQNDSRPTWLRISSVDDLKSSLGKVILMVLIVSFFKHVLELSNWEPTTLLYLSIGILLIAGALYLTHKSGHEESHEVSGHTEELTEEE